MRLHPLSSQNPFWASNAVERCPASYLSKIYTTVTGIGGMIHVLVCERVRTGETLRELLIGERKRNCRDTHVTDLKTLRRRAEKSFSVVSAIGEETQSCSFLFVLLPFCIGGLTVVVLWLACEGANFNSNRHFCRWSGSACWRLEGCFKRRPR